MKKHYNEDAQSIEEGMSSLISMIDSALAKAKGLPLEEEIR